MRSQGSPSRDELANEIAATRAAYHDLLARLDERTWHARSGNPDMLVKELMAHTAWSMRWLARSVDSVRFPRKPLISRVPAVFANSLRKLTMRLAARRVTPERAARMYDDGHQQLIERLASVGSDEWHQTTRSFGVTRTLEWHFRQPAAHFAEHSRDVRAALDSAPSGGATLP